MHTPLCKHAYGEPEEYAERALQAGLKGIIFTCHSPMPRDFWQRVRMSMDEFDTYVALIQRARDAFAGQLDIRLGMESDYFPGFEDWIAELHQKAAFHYCLGSVHFQGKEYMERFGTDDPVEFQRTYKDRGFTVLGVSMDEDGWDAVKPYVARRKINYPTVLATESLRMMYGGVSSLPTTFIVDKDGRIAATHVGLVNKTTYQRAIEQLLAD